MNNMTDIPANTARDLGKSWGFSISVFGMSAFELQNSWGKVTCRPKMTGKEFEVPIKR